MLFKFTEICIDLKSDIFKSKKYYNKIKTCLEKLGSFDLVIKWQPFSDDICPSSIAKYFHDRKISTRCRTPEVTSARRDITKVPKLGEEQLEELVEWVGLVAAGGDLEPSEPYISTYSQPETPHDTPAGHTAVLITQGFFTATDVENICGEIMKYNSSRDNTNWTALSCNTFRDSIYCENGITQFRSINSTLTIFVHNLGNLIHKTVLIE